MDAAFRRKAYQKMLEWKRLDNGSSALLIEGARRVGKSYIAERFAKNEYKSYILIDFAKAPQTIHSLFETEGENLDNLFAVLSAYYKVRLYKRNSVIIFDEVQQCPKARQLIKYLVADGRYDYIETGSLITLKRNIKDIVIPSEEEHIRMYPLDFEEFLWALGDEVTYPLVREHFEKRKPLGQTLHRNVMKLFRQYMLIGGMPQVVEAFAETHDYEAADRIKRRILKLYRDDISKFAEGYESKVYAIFDDIPGQLSKKEKKYKLSSISKKARMREYEDAFVWLAEAMIVSPCLNATDPTVGLKLSEEYTTQKLYMADTGLLVTLAFQDDSYMDNELYRDILLDKINVNEGMLTENVVAQMIKAAGHELFFYSRSDKNNRTNNMEIDFLIKRGRKISPVKVKSSAYRKHSSLDKFMDKFDSRLGEKFILYGKDYMEKDGVIHYPLYMAGLL
ncbi:MAG: ATP-binding protein [Schwartzia sp.]|nr:ATP-binding protein [Schwartzia sp. (in: firmicutes)]